MNVNQFQEPLKKNQFKKFLKNVLKNVKLVKKLLILVKNVKLNRKENSITNHLNVIVFKVFSIMVTMCVNLV